MAPVMLVAALGVAWATARAGAPSVAACGVWRHAPQAIAAERQRLADPEARPRFELRVTPCRGGLARETSAGLPPSIDLRYAAAPDEVRDERAALRAALARSPIADQPSEAMIAVDRAAVPVGSPAGRALMAVFDRLEARDIAAAAAAVAAGELALTLTVDDHELRLAAPLRLERRDGDRWRPIALSPPEVMAIVGRAAAPERRCRYDVRVARVRWRARVRGREYAGGRSGRMPAVVDQMLRASYAD